MQRVQHRLGSAAAMIGPTIRFVATASLLSDTPLTLSPRAGDIVLLLALAVAKISCFATGRTDVIIGAVHLVVFIT